MSFKVHKGLNSGSKPDFAEWVLDSKNIDGYSAIQDRYRYKLYVCTNFQKKHNDGAPNLLWIFKVHIRLNNGSEPDFAEWVLDSNKIDGYSAIKDIYRYKIAPLHQFPEKAQRWSHKSFMKYGSTEKA